MAGYERLKSVGGGGRYDALASDGRTTYPGVGRLVRRLPHAGPAARRGRPHRQPAGARAPCSSPSPTRSPGPPATPSPPRCARAASRAEVAAAAQKFGKQIRYAERRGIPFVWFPQADGTPRGQGHPLAATRWPPTRPPGAHPTEDLRPQVVAPRSEETPVIRTHDAGALRAEHVGQTVTLAGWVARRRDHGGVAFLDLREASGVVQVVIRDEAVAHQLRSEYCLKVTGEVAARPEGNANPNLPTGEIEVDRRPSVEVLSAAAPLPFPIDEPRRRRRGGAAQAPLPRPAPDRPERRAPPAQQGQPGRPRRARRARLRRDRDAHADPQHPRGRPRLPGAGAAPARQLVRPAAEPAAVQAAADGRRHGALLPDRPLLPRRGLPRRPAAGVHPARHRDELRRAGRRDRASPRRSWPRCGG